MWQGLDNGDQVQMEIAIVLSAAMTLLFDREKYRLRIGRWCILCGGLRAATFANWLGRAALAAATTTTT